jgi:hypothetical protein
MSRAFIVWIAITPPILSREHTTTPARPGTSFSANDPGSPQLLLSMRHPRLTKTQQAYLDEMYRRGVTMAYLMPADAFAALERSFGDPLPREQVEELANDYLRELENQGGPKPKRPRGRPRKTPVPDADPVYGVTVSDVIQAGA